MKAVIIEKANRLCLKDIEKPAPIPGWAVVKVKAAAVCATDLELISGNIGAGIYPLIPGHEWSGIVDGVGSTGDSHWIGKRVVGSNDICCLVCHECRSGNWRNCADFREIGFKANGAYAEYLEVPVYGLLELPESISFVQGALCEPIGVAVGSITKADLRFGETVTIIGAGSIGLNILAIAKLAGARRPLVVAYSNKRLDMAKNMGSYATAATQDTDIVSFVNNHHEGLSDVVIDATGSEDCIQLTMKIAKKGGRILLAGYGGNKDIQLHIDDIHIKNLKVIGAGNNWNTLKTSIDLLKDKMISTEITATNFFKLEEYNKALELARTRPAGFVKSIFTF